MWCRMRGPLQGPVANSADIEYSATAVCRLTKKFDAQSFLFFLLIFCKKQKQLQVQSVEKESLGLKLFFLRGVLAIIHAISRVRLQSKVEVFQALRALVGSGWMGWSVSAPLVENVKASKCITERASFT